MDNPFFGELMEQFSDEGHTRLIKDGVSFVMIENLSSLSCYVDHDSMGSLLTALGRWKDLTVYMCADERNLKVQERARAACEKEVRFNEHMAPELVSGR